MRIDNMEYVNQFLDGNINFNFAVMKLNVNSIENPHLFNLYSCQVQEHNKNMASVGSFPNSGFDLFVPNKTIFSCPFKTVFIDAQVKAEMLYYDVSQKVLNTCGYMVFPRSSISKTPLMLANHTGIIDAGYRGNLIGAFRLLEKPENQDTYSVEKDTRLLQIVHPSLCPIFVVIVDEYELTPTDRGAGGFGSTGLVGLKI